jgi:Protein of unknown function (DUF2511)
MMRRPRALVFITLAVASASAACQRADAPIRDPIPDIPAAQQRVVSRQDFDWKWPFSIGHGTLACTGDAIVFRNEGKTYALNAAARSRGFALVDPIWRWQSAGPPRDPLQKLAQNDRQVVFAQLMACEGDGSDLARAQASSCRQNVARARGLTDPELQQISTEGHERRWAPLKQDRASLAPLLEAGEQLCKR